MNGLFHPSISPSVGLSVCLSACLSVCLGLSVCLSACLYILHTFFTMFPSSYHPEIFCDVHARGQDQRSKVKVTVVMTPLSQHIRWLGGELKMIIIVDHTILNFEITTSYCAWPLLLIVMYIHYLKSREHCEYHSDLYFVKTMLWQNYGN